MPITLHLPYRCIHVKYLYIYIYMYLHDQEMDSEIICAYAVVTCIDEQWITNDPTLPLLSVF